MLKLLAAFESYGPEAENTAFDHFGKSIEEIETLLGESSPDWSVRCDLFSLMWKYARGEAGEDGSGRELPSQVRAYLDSIATPAKALHDALTRFLEAYDRDDVAASTVALMFAGPDQPRQENPPPPTKSYEENNWAKLSPRRREVHNQLRVLRGKPPIPPPEIDEYVPPGESKIRPIDPNDPDYVAATREFASPSFSLISSEDFAGINVPGMLRQLEAMLGVAERAKKNKSKGGRPSENIELEVLMSGVAKMFEVATGRKARITADRTSPPSARGREPTKSTYSGRFFRVAELVDITAASATGREPLSNSALGELLKRMQKPRRRATKVQNPS
jgi:hypothetical protein